MPTLRIMPSQQDTAVRMKAHSQHHRMPFCPCVNILSIASHKVLSEKHKSFKTLLFMGFLSPCKYSFIEYSSCTRAREKQIYCFYALWLISINLSQHQIFQILALIFFFFFKKKRRHFNFIFAIFIHIVLFFFMTKWSVLEWQVSLVEKMQTRE